MKSQNPSGSTGVASFVEDLNESIRENPVAAALVGAGVLWMFFGSGKLASGLSNAARIATNSIGDTASSTGNAVTDAVSGAASHSLRATQQVGEAIATQAEKAARLVKDTASAGYDVLSSQSEGVSGTVTSAIQRSARASSEFGREMGTSIQSNLTETLDRQPLLLGAIGLAIGAGIAASFPATSIEKEMMGETGAAVKEKLQEVAHDTSERAKKVFAEVKKEAQAQGLTPDAFKDVAGKVKAVASASKDSIKGRLS